MSRLLNLAASILLITITGCTVFNVANQEESSGPSTYQMKVDPFPFYDEEGNRIQFPFLGGFNAPRPQFVDINDDGYPDLFVQENTDDLKFFEYNPEHSDFPLEWKSNKFMNLDIGEWFRFVDMDQDGDYDLLAEQPYSYIRYYRNEGTKAEPDFVLAVDSLKDASGNPIFSDRQNIPNLTDIDCDEDPDLFIGHLDGTVTRYESTGKDENEIPKFELVTERFEDIEIVKQFGTLHGANTMAFMDIDGDGDQDIFWGDFFEPSVLLLENRGSCSEPDFRGEPQPFPGNDPVQTSGYNAPTLTDFGNDGDADLFLGVLGGAYNANETLAENFLFYEQQPDGNFELKTNQFLTTLDVGNESIPATGDIDGDGDLDLLLANKIDPNNRNTSIVYIYKNKGDNANPEFHFEGTMDLPDNYHYAPAFADIDGDGLDDLLLGNWKGGVDYYRNVGDDFELEIETIVELPRGSNAVPEVADLDNDGDFDILLGASGGSIQYFRNEGTADNPDFRHVKNEFEDIETRHRSSPALLDIDGDGDLDLFLGSKVEGILFYRNTGTPGTPEFRKEMLPFSFKVTQFSAPVFADLDGDGIAEFLSGNKEGGVFYYSR